MNRHDIVFIFDVKDGNPNGDPNNHNRPRQDEWSGHGLVSDVCIKRKIRNYVDLSRSGTSGFDIFISGGDYLNKKIAAAWNGVDTADAVRRELCLKYYDIRTFGAVLSTGGKDGSEGGGDTDVEGDNGGEGEATKPKAKRNNKAGKALKGGAGRVWGPVQVSFARSVDPINIKYNKITRGVVTTEKEFQERAEKGTDAGTFGDKYLVPYGLYVATISVNPHLTEKTPFSEDDLKVLFEALENMFEHDASAARANMAVRAIIDFEHSSELGNCLRVLLHEAVKVTRTTEGPARSFSDYAITVGDVPAGVKVNRVI